MRSGKTNTWRGRNNPKRLLCWKCGKHGVGPPRALPYANPPGAVFHKCRYCKSLLTPSEVESTNFEPQPEPFGYYWQERHSKSGDVVRDGFERGATKPRWKSDVRGFEFVFTPLFSETNR